MGATYPLLRGYQACLKTRCVCDRSITSLDTSEHSFRGTDPNPPSLVTVPSTIGNGNSTERPPDVERVCAGGTSLPLVSQSQISSEALNYNGTFCSTDYTAYPRSMLPTIEQQVWIGTTFTEPQDEGRRTNAVAEQPYDGSLPRPPQSVPAHMSSSANNHTTRQPFATRSRDHISRGPGTLASQSPIPPKTPADMAEEQTSTYEQSLLDTSWS